MSCCLVCISAFGDSVEMDLWWWRWFGDPQWVNFATGFLMPIKACRWHLGVEEARLVHVLSLWMKINWYLSFSLCGLRVHRRQIYFCSAPLRCVMDQWGFVSMTMTCRAAFMCYQMLYNRQVCIVVFANIVLILIKSNCNCVLCLPMYRIPQSVQKMKCSF